MPYRVGIDFVYDDPVERVYVPIGLEIRPLPILLVRVGKRFNQSSLDSDLFSCGLGIEKEPLLVDAAFTIQNAVSDISLKWLLGVTFRIPAYRK